MEIPKTFALYITFLANKSNALFALFFPKISNFHFYDVRNTLEPFWASFMLFYKEK